MKRRKQQPLQKILDQNPPYYVLITCTHPSQDGHMQVEMTYQGDALLAAYLLQEAQSFIDQEEDNDFSLA